MTTIDALRIDPEFQQLITPLSADEFTQLEANILAEGCRDPLVVWDGILVDGHHHYAICTKHGLLYNVVEKQFDSREDAKIWIIHNQFGRRNLSAYTRSVLALQLKEMLGAQARQRMLAGKPLDPVQNSAQDKTRDKLADRAGVSHDTITRVAFIETYADEDMKTALHAGTTSINEVFIELKQAEKEQKQEQNRVERIRKLIQQSRPIDGSLGKFPIIYADPPWRYQDNTTDPTRIIENHYPTMDIDELCALAVPSIMTSDCILFLWVTSPMADKGMRLIDAWGFQYKTCYVWVKDQFGAGWWVRQQHELLFIATKGEPPTPAPADRCSSVINAPRGKHSEKPEEMYERIERMYPDLPKIELFARTRRPGWHVWGLEAPHKERE